MDHSYGFEAFGSRVLIAASDPQALRAARDLANKALLGQLTPHAGPYDVTFELERLGNANLRFQIDGEHSSEGEEERVLNYMDDILRISVAEHSRDLVFIHAGAVGWRDKGILLPAMSFQGKSSFVTELVKAGADYYSDDFAILDRRGHLHPFARPISMRTRDGEYRQYEIDPGRLGAKANRPDIPVRLILLAQYHARARWRPQTLSTGEGVLATLPFAIPLRRYPEKCMRILNTVASQAIFARTSRGDAKRAAMQLLEFVDQQIP